MYDFLLLSSSFGKPVAPPTITASAPPPANETPAQNGDDAASTPPPPPPESSEDTEAPPPPPLGSSEDMEAPPPPPPGPLDDVEAPPPPALQPSFCFNTLNEQSCSPSAASPYLETGKHSFCLMKRCHHSMMTSQLLFFSFLVVEENSFPSPSPPPPPEEDPFPFLTSEDLDLPKPPPPNQEVEGISTTASGLPCWLSAYLSVLVFLLWQLSQLWLLLLLQWCSCPGGVTAPTCPPPLALCL